MLSTFLRQQHATSGRSLLWQEHDCSKHRFGAGALYLIQTLCRGAGRLVWICN